MTRVKFVEVGEYYKTVLNNKWLIKANKEVDYSATDYTGKVIVDGKGNRVAKILDVLGNIEEPYILALPLSENKPQGKLYVEFKERRRGGKRK